MEEPSQFLHYLLRQLSSQMEELLQLLARHLSAASVLKSMQCGHDQQSASVQGEELALASKPRGLDPNRVASCGSARNIRCTHLTLMISGCGTSDTPSLCAGLLHARVAEDVPTPRDCRCQHLERWKKKKCDTRKALGRCSWRKLLPANSAGRCVPGRPEEQKKV